MKKKECKCSTLSPVLLTDSSGEIKYFFLGRRCSVCGRQYPLSTQEFNELGLEFSYFSCLGVLPVSVLKEREKLKEFQFAELEKIRKED